MGVVVERWRPRLMDWEAVATSTSGITGTVHFAGLAVGLYRVTTDNPAENDIERIEVSDDSAKPLTSTINLAWPPKKVLLTRSFEGNLSSFPDEGDPSVPLARVQLTVLEAHSGRNVAIRDTDQDGNFRIDGLPPGLYFVRLAGEDTPEQRQRFFGEKLHGTVAVEYNPLAKDAMPTMPLHVAITSCMTLAYRVVN